MKHNNRVIPYKCFDPKKELVNRIGDFQSIPIIDGENIKIMPAFFRNYGSLSQVLVVRVNIDKKYSFLNFGSVTSKEFGNLVPTDHEWLTHTKSVDNILFTLSLEQVEAVERKKKILRDTLIVTVGDKEFKFASNIK